MAPLTFPPSSPVVEQQHVVGPKRLSIDYAGENVNKPTRQQAALWLSRRAKPAPSEAVWLPTGACGAESNGRNHRDHATERFRGPSRSQPLLCHPPRSAIAAAKKKKEKEEEKKKKKKKIKCIKRK